MTVGCKGGPASGVTAIQKLRNWAPSGEPTVPTSRAAGALARHSLLAGSFHIDRLDRWMPSETSPYHRKVLVRSDFQLQANDGRVLIGLIACRTQQPVIETLRVSQ